MEEKDEKISRPCACFQVPLTPSAQPSSLPLTLTSSRLILKSRRLEHSLDIKVTLLQDDAHRS